MSGPPAETKDPTIVRVGPVALSTMLHANGTCHSSAWCEGLMFGHSFVEEAAGDASENEQVTVRHVRAAARCGASFTFYDRDLSVDARRLPAGVIGWFRCRGKSGHQPSLREQSVTAALQAAYPDRAVVFALHTSRLETQTNVAGTLDLDFSFFTPTGPSGALVSLKMKVTNLEEGGWKGHKLLPRLRGGSGAPHLPPPRVCDRMAGAVAAMQDKTGGDLNVLDRAIDDAWHAQGALDEKRRRLAECRQKTQAVEQEILRVTRGGGASVAEMVALVEGALFAAEQEVRMRIQDDHSQGLRTMHYDLLEGAQFEWKLSVAEALPLVAGVRRCQTEVTNEYVHMLDVVARQASLERVEIEEQCRRKDWRSARDAHFQEIWNKSTMSHAAAKIAATERSRAQQEASLEWPDMIDSVPHENWTRARTSSSHRPPSPPAPLAPSPPVHVDPAVPPGAAAAQAPPAAPTSPLSDLKAHCEKAADDIRNAE